MQRPLPNSYWVLPGRFLAGEYPLAGLRALLAAGIDLFIDLTEPDECPPYDGLLPGDIHYLRAPIPDHGIPDDAARMAGIQEDIASALTAGRRIYLHCRAGIGRTGMTAGCYLVEQGFGGDEALVELNRLWLQSARSASWLEIPQTPEQHDYVRSWVRPAAAIDKDAAALRPLRTRFQGAMLGLAVGDALAAPAQYQRSGGFAPVGDLIGGGPFDLPRGAWSDDTAMALCLAESLAELDHFDPRDQVRRYDRWRQEGHLSATGQCVGITAATARALAQAGWRRQPFAGAHDPALTDPEPLSRVAPAVLHGFGDPRMAIGQAVDAARSTCQSPLVLDACRALAAMLYCALRGETRTALLAPAPELYGGKPLKAAVAELMGQAPGVDPPLHAADAGALGVLEAVRWALARGNSFRDGALRAVNLGGNADVIGAVYGQLAGAHYGVAAIPSGWLASLALHDQISALADRLLTRVLVRRGGL